MVLGGQQSDGLGALIGSDMKYRKIITAGCSFSDPETSFTWPNQLENYISNINSNVKFDHRGLSSQGQELIQKKSLHAIDSALSEGYKPNEIAVFVMWTSNDRKSFYVDNPDFIDVLVSNWKKSQQGWQCQLADLENKLPNKKVINSSNKHAYNLIPYNATGGWLITNCHVTDDIPMMRDYFMMSRSASSVSAVSSSLENILLLQLYCKYKGIKLYQQYNVPFIEEDFIRLKDHQAVKYLYGQLDYSMFIDKVSMYTYLQNDPNNFISKSDSHPSEQGHRLWVNNVVIPKLQADGFFL